MTALQLLNLLTEYAKEYRTNCPNSLIRNNHMHDYKGTKPSLTLVDAILTDFINGLAAQKYGIDYALYSSDLLSKEEE